MRLDRKKISSLKKEYSKKKDAIEQRLAEFSRIPPEEYFYEGCFCLLTPQTSGKRSWEAVMEMKKADFWNSGIDPKQFLGRIRFHHTKAKRLLEFREMFPAVLKELTSRKSPKEIASYIIHDVKGMGLKEASHYLRNIGHRNLAILDRHILKNLQEYGALKALPRTLTKKRYSLIEKRFRQFSEEIRIPIDHLDLLFWSNETGEIFK
ncbi:MAG TPA: DNA lyase [Candidatus Nanoarchaeia archaeon]|nr:DNA lyase [Candidatus Nanoarchaeia archaeon]